MKWKVSPQSLFIRPALVTSLRSTRFYQPSKVNMFMVKTHRFWGENRASGKEEARRRVSGKRSKLMKREKNGPGWGKE